MKIAIVRQRYNPFGGAERFVERALAALAGEGAEISLITRSWAGAPQAGFRQITCDPPYSRIFGRRVARDRSFSAAVQREIASNRYDIIQSHERIPGSMIFRAGDGVHAAWLDHRARGLNWLGKLGQRLSSYHRYVLGAEAAMFSHPNLKTVICNSKMVAEEVRRYYQVPETRLKVIYNGVDTSIFHPGLADEFRSKTRHDAGISETAPLLVYVGSGFERKGVPRLLQAFAYMREKRAHLAIVGSDRRAASMKLLAVRLGIANRIHFTGPLKDVRPWYGAADGFVLPTIYDPCPNAALEALASGLPIVTSTSCGASEWVSEGENGWVVDAFNIEVLVQRLDDLASWAGQMAPRLAARAVAEPLTLSAMAERLLNLYRGLSVSL